MIGSAVLTGGAAAALKGAAVAAKAAGTAVSLSRTAKAGQLYLRASVAEGLITAGEGVQQWRKEGFSWGSALMVGGGLLGTRMDVGDLGKIGGRIGKVTKGLEAVERPALAVLKPVGKVAVALLDTKVARGLGKGAFHVVNTPLSVIVHKGLGNIHKGAHDWVSKHLNRMGFRVCFVAGTPIVGPWGSKAIEDYKDYETYGDDCDTLISRDEFNDDGILTVRRVLRRFERIGPVLDVVINGQRIGTTHEHPFFVQGQGWTKAQELRIGDLVRLMQPGWATVEAVEDTGRLERVYNLEIEDDHTYFVGCQEWGWAVWSHNTGCGPELAGEILAKDAQYQLLKQRLRQQAWAGNMDAVNATMGRVARRALREGNGNWQAAEAALGRYAEAMNNRFARVGSSKRAVVDATVENGSGLRNGGYGTRTHPWNTDGSPRLGTSRIELAIESTALPGRPVISAVDISYSYTKPFQWAKYTDGFGHNVPIADVRMSRNLRNPSDPILNYVEWRRGGAVISRQDFGHQGLPPGW